MPDEETIPLTERQQNVVKILEKFLEMAKKGDLLNVFVVADHIDNNYRCQYTTSEDVFSLMGYVVAIATRNLTWQVTPPEDEDDD
jgi:hypothetical protein